MRDFSTPLPPNVLATEAENLADELPRAAKRTGMKPTVLSIAEDEYPEKLVRVTSRAQVRELRKVRAPR